jgi:thiamine kinase
MAELPAQVPGFETARVRRRLGSGPVSDSWLLEHEGRALVLRKDRPCAARIGLDRERERAALAEAHGHGLGPACLLADPREGLLLTRFIPGQAWLDRTDGERAANWMRLGALLRRVHALAPQSVQRFEPAVVFRRYACAADPVGSAPGLGKATALAEALYGDAPWVLCHHDPHLGNVVGEPGTLIDWEYAALGHPLYDLACIIDHHGLDERAVDALVTGWADGDPPVSLATLPGFVELVSLVNTLWHRAVESCV